MFELLIKPNSTVNFIILEGCDKMAEFKVYKEKVKYNNKYVYIPCNMVFDEDSRFSKTTIRYSFVYLEKSKELKHFEVKYNVFQSLKYWEVIHSDTVALRRVSITRKGSSLDTIYKTAVYNYWQDSLDFEWLYDQFGKLNKQLSWKLFGQFPKTSSDNDCVIIDWQKVYNECLKFGEMKEYEKAEY